MTALMLSRGPPSRPRPWVACSRCVSAFRCQHARTALRRQRPPVTSPCRRLHAATTRSPSSEDVVVVRPSPTSILIRTASGAASRGLPARRSASHGVAAWLRALDGRLATVVAAGLRRSMFLAWPEIACVHIIRRPSGSRRRSRRRADPTCSAPLRGQEDRAAGSATTVTALAVAQRRGAEAGVAQTCRSRRSGPASVTRGGAVEPADGELVL